MYGRPNAPPPHVLPTGDIFQYIIMWIIIIINSKRSKVTHFEWILILLCVLSCGNIISYNSNYEGILKGTSICLRVSFTPDQNFEQKVFSLLLKATRCHNTANRLFIYN